MANQKPSNRNTKVSNSTSLSLLHLTISTTNTKQYFFTPIEKIRVGRDYQAVCPQLVPEPDRRPELMNERALLVWSPTKEIPDMKCKCAAISAIYAAVALPLINLLFFPFAIRSGGIHFGGQREIRLQWGTGIGHAVLAQT